MSNSRARRTLGTWFAEVTSPISVVATTLVFVFYGGGTVLAVLGVAGLAALDIYNPALADMAVNTAQLYLHSEPFRTVFAGLFYLALLSLLYVVGSGILVYTLEKADAFYRRLKAL